jgi:hypothetical protein
MVTDLAWIVLAVEHKCNIVGREFVLLEDAVEHGAARVAVEFVVDGGALIGAEADEP